MTETLSDCRFCSIVSKANGEDPIGSAPVADGFLIVEIPQPWSAQLFSEPQIQPILAWVKTLALRGIRIRPIAIAPDREHSQSGDRRVLFFSRSAEFFARFDRQEYLVPEAEVASLAIALLKSEGLDEFAAYRQVDRPVRDILVCTHGNVDAACARFGFPIYDKLRKQYADSGLRVWRCTHFGGHQYAPTLLDLPSGRYWAHLEAETLDTLVNQRGSPDALRSHYRGWAGLGKFEQIAEREIWMREGWAWLDYPKRGQIVRLGEGWLKGSLRSLLQLVPSKRLRFWLNHTQQDAPWATVRIEFQRPDGSIGRYEARVEISGQILTAIRSATQMPLVPVNQYHVRDLRLE
ncbi:MAG: sucrase ferredoxin [Leptolyngbyaceae cyanobacterium SM1_3_5]|nr:sucrase ferredoxin [Leptolyngbyaceae cyanobacterium SM1_3_5]